MAFAKSQLGAGMRMPQAGTVFISVKEADKTRDAAGHPKKLADLGFKPFVATGGTQQLPRKTRAFPPPRSTRCWKAARMLWTPSRTAISSWC
jgi:hypothetical protein